jgi:hypothetical protein
VSPFGDDRSFTFEHIQRGIVFRFSGSVSEADVITADVTLIGRHGETRGGGRFEFPLFAARPFRNTFAMAMSEIDRIPRAKAYTLEELRRAVPRSHMRWTDEEAETLRREFSAGLSEEEMARRHERRIGGIHSRLIVLGLIPPEPD